MSTLSRNAIVRKAEQEVARRQSATTAPRVIWAELDETPKRFAARIERACADTKALVLAVAPHGHPVSAPARPVYLPRKGFRLLHPSRTARYRVARGGRGSAKSWSIARVLIITALARRVRILCAREFQRSIAESSHRLLSDQIEAMGLGRWFDIKNASITSHVGSEIIFEGLFANVNKIKSLEGIDIAWTEEAARISANSWDVLVPTIRKESSEIWVNFNPELETDPTYERFVTSPPPETLIENLTWIDNPWFPAVLEAERVYLLSVDPDAHAHVWGGECRKQSDAQIFKSKYVIEPFEPAADWSGPYYGSDFGFSQDPTTLLKCWIHERTLYIEHEAYEIGCDIDKTPALFDTVPGARDHVIRADCARPETISYLQRHEYPRVTGVEKWPNSVEEGVRHLRAYQRIVVHTRCTHTADEMRLYSFKVDRLTGDVLSDVIDRHRIIQRFKTTWM
jgi:phage terminase large subunit